MKKEGKTTPVTQVEDSLKPISAARSVPVHNWRAHWLTAREFARVMGRDEQTVYWWIRNGILADFGIPTCQFRQGRMHSGRIFIRNIF